MVSLRDNAGHWRVYAAAGVAITLLCAAAPDRKSQSRAPPVAGQSKDHPLYVAPAIVPTERAYVAAQSCEKPQSAEQENLCIARQAAQATRDQANWARAGFWGTLIGSVATAAAALFAGVSARAARQGADAAAAAATIAENALRAGQRAFVFPSFEPQAVLNVKTQRIQQWVITPIWQNSGETPTRFLKNHVSIKAFDGDPPDNWHFPDLWYSGIKREEGIRIPLALSAKSTVRGQRVGVSVQDMIEVVAGKKTLLLWGWCTYRDVLPNSPLHVTRFAVRVAVSGDGINASKTSFSWPYLAKYNCSDEECELQGYPASWEAPQETPPD